MTGPIPDLQDPNLVLTYGADAQQQVAECSEMALQNLKVKDLGEVSGRIEDLLRHLKGPEEDSSLRGWLKKPAERLKLRYRKTGEAVDRIAAALRRQRDLLMKDVEMLELLYAVNREQYRALTGYLDRGREALETFREETILPLRKRAETGGGGESAQAVRDAEEQYRRFEKKLHDLELTRTVSLQMAPQIRLLQNNNTVLAEKIQSSLVNAIPLWKNRMALTLSMETSRTALGAQKKIAEITNALLLKNARDLKETTLQVTREWERSLIDTETLKQADTLLIETLDEMLRIREEGRAERSRAEGELRRLEREIHFRLRGGATPKELP